MNVARFAASTYDNRERLVLQIKGLDESDVKYIGNPLKVLSLREILLGSWIKGSFFYEGVHSWRSFRHETKQFCALTP